MPLETHTPFVIAPPDDFLTRHPHLGSLGSQLSIRYIHKEVVTDAHLKQLGQGLWEALNIADLLEETWSRARPRVLPIVVRSDDPAILNLPWECLHHPEEGFLGRHEGFTLCRQLKTVAAGEAALPKGPLNVLLFTSLPDDLEEKGRLDTEAEQENVLEALDPWIHEGLIKLTAPDDGRFSTFKELIRGHDYHLVFLSGHGMFEDNRLADKSAQSFFIFEGEDGMSQGREAGEIARCFSGKTATQCVALSACQLGKVSSEDLAASMIFSLLKQGVPHVIGMRESIFDLAGI
ncbi:MAG: CHAT domain-containing protein, partial [Desulfobacterales bacterium]|nr:CHAT domain-containing protein [Desulfobacterales bacterium]